MIAQLNGPLTESMEGRFAALDPHQLIQWAASEFAGELAVSTSFGIQSAVTLHLVTSILPDVPVIWVDTGYLPEETYAYGEQLRQALGLNLHTYRAHLSPEAMEAKHGKLWQSTHIEDLNLYDRLRKVEPMQRAIQTLGVRGWISGLRAEQTEFRKRLPPIKRTDQHYRIYPILEWSSRDIYQYMEDHGLPQHPLFYQGYTTVGDAHSSRPVQADENDRDTRFHGLKQECGLHL